MMRTCGLVNG